MSENPASAVMPEARGARLRRLAAYGVGDYGLNIYWNMLSLFLVFWYTTIVGLEPRVAGAIYFIGMVWDAISDPIVANLAERVRTEKGTYRPFILYGSGALGVLFVLLFWAPPFSGAALLATLVIAAILFRTGYTLVAIPYAALSARLTFDSVERTELAGVRMFFAFGGLLTVSLLVPPLLRALSGGADYVASAFMVVAGFGALVATGALLLCYVLTSEKPLPEGTQLFVLSSAQVRRVLLGNSALMILLSVIFLQSSGTASLMVSLLFFLETQEGLASQETVLTCFAIATMAGVPIWTLVIRRIGKKRCWFLASGMIAAAGATMLALGPLPVVGVPLPILAYGLCLGSFAVMLWSFVPDTVEYGQVTTGVRAEGISFGAVMVAQKLAGASMGLVVGFVLSKVGFNPELTEQTARTGRGLLSFLAIAPGALFLLSALAVRSLPLDRKRHADMVSALSGNRRSEERSS
ncbi:MFS transporter [Parvularcula lutaonensis]|uniref:MFS transporter n=1 Tax=Parvularcula lutaonensis TaxID=491923 RepID=A0ABV7MCV7_9PROT|nr:glycoside-pentoside-hexuronide (GPH):cation symporter [Parvularcula lutaonensis]GGY48772.1 MFS transporter [Parvularcula lutaonensis]